MRKTAEGIMAHSVLTCAPDETKTAVAERMAGASMCHPPVKSAGKIAGLIATRDVLDRRNQTTP